MARLRTRTSRIAASTAGLLSLAACAGPSASPWRELPPAPRAEGPAAPVFCYRTLADVACYFERDLAVPGQLVAVYPRPTGDPLTATHWRYRASGVAAPAEGVTEP
ncbi:MAG: hypothetical protein K6T74_08875 [Geminicoccaceae bacterium]|nr:hypothetical protein [Geminicoccaceae bacterium]